MLIAPKEELKEGDVICVRLVTGEEMVARITAIGGNSYTVTKPVLLQLHVDQQTRQMQVAFAPYMVGVDESSKFEIHKQHMLVSPVRPRKDVEDNYLSATSSLAIPKKGLIT